ncbi:MAG: hypothetical protein HWN67_14460 [Candidatus Helarchaeota archaeon]|nr:hypothetical protein [Candidatus Helarchaeota archaeon]
MEDDILALNKVIDLIKEFTDKNPIKKYKINYKRIKEKVNQIKNLKIKDIKEKKKLLEGIIRKLELIIRREFHPKIYFIVGGHGGVIIDDMGFCEFDSPKYAIDRLLEKMNLAIETQMPYNLEIAICCLDWLKRRFPKEFSEFLKLFKLGRFEIINPSYSQPYNLIIGTESNIKQFEYGLKVLKELGINCNIYYCSESSLHPQIPQILKGFEIQFSSLRTRLLGQTPTTNSGYIDWIGLDGIKIDTITDQTSVFNGEYWHGTFFREIPNLLFQAVARPFMKYVIYSSIEDYIMPQSYQEEVWRISRHSSIFGEFLLCSEFFKKIKKDGEFKFNRDNFSMGDYIFIPSDLFLNNKNCESYIISAEILNCILGLFNEQSDDLFFDELWKKLLLTQAHDNYAVPFIRTGDYTAQQLSVEEYNKLGLNNEKISISDLSCIIQKEIQDESINYIHKNLVNLSRFLENSPDNSSDIIKNLLIFNPSPFTRKDIFSIKLKIDKPSDLTLLSDEKVEFQYKDSILKLIPEVPPLGYKIYSLIKKGTNTSKAQNFLYSVRIREDNKAIEIKFHEKKICELSFKSRNDYELYLENYDKTNIEETNLIAGKIRNTKFQIKIRQYNNINRLEFFLDSNLLKEIVLIPAIKIKKSFLNYPFGIEETKRSNIQSLDFLWLKGERKGILFMQKNSQKFIIDRESFEVRNIINPNGKFEFAIAITDQDDTNSVSNHINSFQYKLLGVELNNNLKFSKKSQSFLSMQPSVSLINLWRRENNFYLRIFNPTNNKYQIKLVGPLVRNKLKEIDLNYKEIQSMPDNQIQIDPWKFKTILI